MISTNNSSSSTFSSFIIRAQDVASSHLKIASFFFLQPLSKM
jgi:hypothetical protein